jgi:hypothetical protein
MVMGPARLHCTALHCKLQTCPLGARYQDELADLTQVAIQLELNIYSRIIKGVFVSQLRLFSLASHGGGLSSILRNVTWDL